MANLFLTGKCNIKCPYCFADEFVNKTNEEFSIENLKKAINFIKTDNHERIGLIGGEPLLYPHFKEVINLLNNDNDISQYIIYTNGIHLGKYIKELTNKKVLILINCNSPDDIGGNFERLKQNIKLLKEKEIINFVLGINLYSENLDYSYIFKLLKLASQHNLRFSITIPDLEKEETINTLDSLNNFKPYIINFFKDCLKNETVPYFDCNALPFCLLNYERKRLLIKLKLLARKYDAIDLIYSSRKCEPVVDIFPDLTAIRCFGLAKHLKVSIKQFKSLPDLKKYFYNKIDVYANLSFQKTDCENCKSRLYDKCGICYTYKMQQCSLLKESILKAITFR